MESFTTLSSLTVVKLKEKCRELGLGVGGRKKDLISRLSTRLAPTVQRNDISGAPLPQLELSPVTPRKRKPAEENIIVTTNSSLTSSDIIKGKKTKVITSNQDDITVVSDAELSCPRTSLILKTHQSDHKTPAGNAGQQIALQLSKAASSTPPSRPQPEAFSIPSLLPPGKKGKTFTLDPGTTVGPTSGPGKDVVQARQAGAASLHSSANSSIKRSLFPGANQRVKYKPIALAVKQPEIVENTTIVLGDSCPASASTRGGSGRDNTVIDTVIDSDSRTRPRLTTRLSGAEEQVQRPLPHAIRRFKPLKVNKNVEKSIEVCKNSEEKQFESTRGRVKALQTPHRPTMDDDITASIIGNPPRISLRRRVEKLAEILALVVFNAFGDSPGKSLMVFSVLSWTCRYASTLAFSRLISLEFAGARAVSWLKVKDVDIEVADLRAFYWHRVSERDHNIGKLRKSWMNRVWKFLARNDGCLAKDNELSFEGINCDLFAEPDIQGQLDVAIRFWIRRFYNLVSQNGGGYPRLLADLKMGKVHEVGLADEKSRAIWKVKIATGESLFVVGTTGEVAQFMVEPRRALSGSAAEAGISSAAVGLAKPTLQRKEKASAPADYGSAGDDLGFLLLPPPPLPTGALRENSLHHPFPRFVVAEGSIHKSIILQHHRALAERWVLSNTDADAIARDFTLGLYPGVLVESVRCSGEKWNSSMKGLLAPGIGFVQTCETGWFVLEETGQNIAQEDYGIQGLWATILGVHEDGTALSDAEIDELELMFR